MTLLEILDEVMLLSGMNTETSYADSDNDAVKRLVSIANKEATRLARHPWAALRSIYSLTLSAATQYPLPDDFNFFVPDTMFSSDSPDAMNFPADPSDWVYMKVNSSAGADEMVRVIGTNIEFHDPTSGANVQFEYISNYPVKDSGGTPQQRFTADTDTFRMDDDMLIKCVTAQYKRLMGLPDWQVDQAEAMQHELTLKGQDGGSKTVGPCEEGFSTPYYDLWRPHPNTP